MPSEAIHVEGLQDLVRAYKVANREMARDVRTAIEQAGEPIRQLGSEMIRRELSGMSRTRLPWWRLRLGVERNTIGYVVPEERGRFSKRRPERYARPKLARLISEREQRALEANKHRVEAEFVDALNQVARAWARV